MLLSNLGSPCCLAHFHFFGQQQTFTVKDQIINILGFGGHAVSITLFDSVLEKASINNMQKSGSGCVPINLCKNRYWAEYDSQTIIYQPLVYYKIFTSTYTPAVLSIKIQGWIRETRFLFSSSFYSIKWISTSMAVCKGIWQWMRYFLCILEVQSFVKELDSCMNANNCG